jgi:hypothetical protein
LTVSTSECTPSLSIAELPDIPAATNLAMAIIRLPARATKTTLCEPEEGKCQACEQRYRIIMPDG